MSKTLAIILPCYNPPLGWELNLIKHIQALEKKIEENIKVIVADDGSLPKISEEVIATLKKKITIDFVFMPKNKGKGAALRNGISKINADYYIYTDYDFPFSDESILRVYKKLQESYDVVCGFRNKSYYKGLPKRRKWVSKNMQFLTKYVLKLANFDTQAGLKGFNNKGKAVFLETKVDKFLFDTEFIYLSEKIKKLRVTSVLATLNKNIEFSNMGINVLLRELKHFVQIVFYRK